MGETKYFICKMEIAKDGLGIVSEAYYNNDKSIKHHATNKKFESEIVFKGSFLDCYNEKKKLLRK